MPSGTHTTDPASWQEHLDFLLPRSATLRVDQLAEAAGLDERTVMRAFDGAEGGSKKVPWLHGFEFNAGKGQRYTRRIPRDAAILWLAACANYAPEDFIDRICEVLSHRGTRELLVVQGRLAALIKEKPQGRGIQNHEH
jgi:hypothetical protein